MMEDGEYTAKMDQILAGAADTARTWATLYHALVEKKIPEGHAAAIVCAYVGGIARAARLPGEE